MGLATNPVSALTYKETGGENPRTSDCGLEELPYCCTRGGETHWQPPFVIKLWLWQNGRPRVPASEAKSPSFSDLGCPHNSHVPINNT